MTFGDIARERRVALTIGPGGVGKTTVAAALGLQAAVAGRRALVLTVDPAQRLADALGLPQLRPGETHRIDALALQAVGVPARAPLSVAMFDARSAWAGIIEREAPPARQRQILEHPFFERMSRDLAGAREYAAMEELYHLYLRGGHDLIVLDTPPTVHGMDLLEAPDRVLDVLESDGVRWLLRPALLAGRVGARVLDFSGGYAVRTLTRFTGLEFLRELAGFVHLFADLLEGFRLRASAVRAVLRSQVSACLLVTTAAPGPAAECTALLRRLRQREMHPELLLVNRITPRPAPLPADSRWRDDLLRRLTREHRAGWADPASLLAAMEAAREKLSRLAERDAADLAALRTGIQNDCPLTPVPLLPEDVHDLAGLERLRTAIVQGAQEAHAR